MNIERKNPVVDGHECLWHNYFIYLVWRMSWMTNIVHANLFRKINKQLDKTVAMESKLGDN